MRDEDRKGIGKKQKSVPFDFVLDQLAPLEPYTKPMFGCTAVYVGERILFILRLKDAYPGDNGVWVATTSEHHPRLRRKIPSMRSIRVFGPGETGWQVVPMRAKHFESHVSQLCQMVLDGDEAVGKIPSRKKRTKKARTSKKKSSVGKPVKAKPKVVRWEDLQGA